MQCCAKALRHHHFFQILLPDCLGFCVIVLHSVFTFKAFIYECFMESGKGEDKEDVAGVKVSAARE